jgi:hypothetical protein
VSNPLTAITGAAKSYWYGGDTKREGTAHDAAARKDKTTNAISHAKSQNASKHLTDVLWGLPKRRCNDQEKVTVCAFGDAGKLTPGLVVVFSIFEGTPVNPDDPVECGTGKANGAPEEQGRILQVIPVPVQEPGRCAYEWTCTLAPLGPNPPKQTHLYFKADCNGETLYTKYVPYGEPEDLNPWVEQMILRYQAKYQGMMGGYWWPRFIDKPTADGGTTLAVRDSCFAKYDEHPDCNLTEEDYLKFHGWKGNIEEIHYHNGGKNDFRGDYPTVSKRGGKNMCNAHGNKSYCSGICYEIFFKALELHCNELGIDYKKYKIGNLTYADARGASGNKFSTPWFAGAGAPSAITKAGIGTAISGLGKAKRGDFVQIKRREGGHAVIIWKVLDQAAHPGQFVYWSTQGTWTDGGVGFRLAVPYGAEAGDPNHTVDHYKSITIGRVDKLKNTAPPPPAG